MNPLLRAVCLLCTALALVCLPYKAGADHPSTATQRDAVRSQPYKKGRISFQVVSGALFSPVCFASEHQVFDYVQTNLRIGRMLNCPAGSDSVFRGNLEAILELSNSHIYKGSGNYIGGVTGLVRYNFVQPDARLVPYMQGGGGIVYTDAYKDESQTAIGQAIEFTLQASLGLHRLIGKDWSLDIEAMFHHISNAGLSDRNHGVNAIGGFVGLTYFYDKLWR